MIYRNSFLIYQLYVLNSIILFNLLIQWYILNIDCSEVWHLYNSNMLIEIQRLLHLNKSKAFKFCKTLVTSSLTMLCDINLIDNNFQEKVRIYEAINRCTCCSFYHDIIYTENSVKDFKWRYPLLTIQQCEQIINNCLIKKYFSGNIILRHRRFGGLKESRARSHVTFNVRHQSQYLNFDNTVR